MIRITTLLALSLLYSASVFANDFEQFVIAPSSQHAFRGTIFFGDYLKVEPDALCNTKKLYPSKWTVIDQEGGVVARLNAPDTVPPNPSQAVQNGLQAFQARLDGVAHALKAKCLDVDLAPVADTDYVSSRFNRSYSSNPAVVNQYALAFSKALNHAGIVSAWKHFPGYTNNTHPLSHESDLYKASYNPRYVESAIDYSGKDSLDDSMLAFRSNAHNLLLMNIGMFPAYGSKPAIFSEALIAKAHQVQPNSLLVSDDISELRLDDEKVLFLFKNIDLYIFSSEADALKFCDALDRLEKAGNISEFEISEKQRKIEIWQKLRLSVFTISQNLLQ
jgi:beta-N-acetylhexosaminidase